MDCPDALLVHVFDRWQRGERKVVARIPPPDVLKVGEPELHGLLPARYRWNSEERSGWVIGKDVDRKSHEYELHTGGRCPAG